MSFKFGMCRGKKGISAFVTIPIQYQIACCLNVVKLIMSRTVRKHEITMKPTGFKSIDEYIATFPPDIQKRLSQLRVAIHEAAPKAEETISYQMPAFKQNGVLVYFAAFKNHIGFFPTGKGMEAFKDKLSGYKTSKGTIQFPLNQPLPLDLVKEIVKVRVNQNQKEPK